MFKLIARIIQFEWINDDNINKIFLLDWEINKKLVKSIEMEINMVKKKFFCVFIKRIIGLIFCQVIKNKLFNHVKFLQTVKIHEWKGHSPIFIIIVIKKIILLEFSSFINTILGVISINVTIIVDEIDWMIKKFKRFSFLFFLIRFKMNPMFPISNSIHIIIQILLWINIKVGIANMSMLKSQKWFIYKKLIL